MGGAGLAPRGVPLVWGSVREAGACRRDGVPNSRELGLSSRSHDAVVTSGALGGPFLASSELAAPSQRPCAGTQAKCSVPIMRVREG